MEDKATPPAADDDTKLQPETDHTAEPDISVPDQSSPPVPDEQSSVTIPVQVSSTEEPPTEAAPTLTETPPLPAEATPPAPSTLTPEALADPALATPPHAVGTVFSPMTDSGATPIAHVSTRRKGKARLFVLIAGVFVVLLGSSAAAYYGYYMPNQPNNKLAAALANLAQKKQLNINGTIDVTSTIKKSSTPGVAVDFNVGADLDQTELATSGTVGVDGTQFPFDVRFVNQDIYFKVGGLDSLAKVLPSSTSSVVSPYLQVVSSVNNQWYVVDRSFLDSLGSSATCTANLSFALSNSDASKIEAAYEKYPLFNVTDSSPATVEGVDTTKMDVSQASNQTTEAFTNQLTNLSIVQNIRKCLGDSDVSSQVGKAIAPAENSASNGQQSMAVYVTADKQIKKIEITSSSNNTLDVISLTFENQAPTIAAPTGAKPIQDLVEAFLGSSGLSGLTNLGGLSN